MLTTRELNIRFEHSNHFDSFESRIALIHRICHESFPDAVQMEAYLVVMLILS